MKDRAPAPGRSSRDAEPYGDEALAYSRAHVLQRDVQIKIDSCDRGGNFIGSLWYGPGGSGSSHQKQSDLAVELLELGYAHTVDFSLARCPNKDKLVEAEEKAKKARLNIWSLPGALEAEESTVKEMEVDEVLPEVCVSHIEGINHFYIQASSHREEKGRKQEGRREDIHVNELRCIFFARGGIYTEKLDLQKERGTCVDMCVFFLCEEGTGLFNP